MKRGSKQSVQGTEKITEGNVNKAVKIKKGEKEKKGK